MSTNAPDPTVDLAELERKYDPEMAFRPTGRTVAIIVTTALVAMSLYHYYAAGFGLIRELVHRGIHTAFVLGLIFMVFGSTRTENDKLYPASVLRPGGIGAWDWVLAVLAVVAALYLPLLPADVVAMRVGNPSTFDVFMGSTLILLTLEAARRSIGWTLVAIALAFLIYGLFGQYMPGVLKHPGASWPALVNHLYMTDQGIYGIAIGAVAKYVFLFVLFGVLATRIGLGKLFIDIASSIAGRFAGGPAKVAIFSSALLGTISGSSIANTVTTGALTIPAMKKVGYRPHFAGAVEAAASTGGQITPPIMGAAAFIMVEFLEIPYRQIVFAAIFPALLHYMGVFAMVHFEAKRLGLRGLRPDEMPEIVRVLRENWLAMIPLLVLMYLILSGRTPDYAAVWGITACVIVGFINPHERLTIRDLIDSLALGAKYALAVGAAAAVVGIVVGVVTLTGTAFRLSFIITQTASEMGATLSALFPEGWLSINTVALFFTLLFTAIACILMGAGIPTTATYIILVSVAAPALGLLGVEPLVAHFFVFYYGVLADITPPVALAAYAAAGIAGSNPFQTGNTAFRLGIAKALVPFVFVYSPSLLLVNQGFTWTAFTVTLIGAALGILMLAGAFTGFIFAPMRKFERIWLGLVALLFVIPGLSTMALGIVLAAPIFIRQMVAMRRQPA